MTNLCDYPSLQAAIDATPPGGTLYIGRQRVAFESVIIDHSLTIKGSGQYLGMRPTFCNPQWVMPELDNRMQGTILECTATAGIAVKVINKATLHLEDVMLRGKQQVNTLTGIEIGNGAAASANWNYSSSMVWKNVALCNFKVGLYAFEVYQSQFDMLQLWGCETGAIFGNAVTSEGVVTSTFTQLDSSGCGVVVDASNIVACTFINGTFQGVQDTGLKLRKANRCIFDGLYFENAAPCQYAIDLSSGTSNEFRRCGFASVSADRFRIGVGSQHNVYEAASQGMHTTIINGHYNTVRGSGNLMAYVTNTGLWNVFEGHHTDISNPQTTNFLNTMEWANTPARRGGLLFKHGDPVLMDTVTGTKYRLQVTNGILGVLAL